MKQFQLGIVIPTYNERDNISELLSQIHKECTQNNIKTLVLIMDDNSPDQTSKVAEETGAKLHSESFEVRVSVRPTKMGLASAYIQGFEKIKHEVEYLLSMDADLSHQPKYIKDFIGKAKEGYELVIGSRYVKDGGVKGWGKHRLLLSRGGSLYCRILLGVGINDFTGGYNLYASKMFDEFDINSIKAQGYLFQIEMKYNLVKRGYKFTEIPIVFPDRIHGVSKISKNIIVEALMGVVRLRFKLK